jgi:hypothetical protein
MVCLIVCLACDVSSLIIGGTLNKYTEIAQKCTGIAKMKSSLPMPKSETKYKKTIAAFCSNLQQSQV